MNALQYLNAHRQIFFKGMVKKKQIDSIVNKHFQTRMSLKPTTVRFGTYVFTFGEDNRICLKLSFVNLNQGGADSDRHGLERAKLGNTGQDEEEADRQSSLVAE